MENELNILQTINRVEISPFLYTRILNKIQNRKKEIVSIKWAVAAAACIMLVFAVNVNAIQENRKRTKADLAEIFSLKQNNTLYINE